MTITTGKGQYVGRKTKSFTITVKDDIGNSQEFKVTGNKTTASNKVKALKKMYKKESIETLA